MSRNSRLRERLLVSALVLVLMVLSAAGALYEGRSEAPVPLDVTSSAPDGTLALSRWLTEIGFKVSADLEPAFRIPEEAGMAFVFEPAFASGFTPDELEVVDDWVAEGGTLVYAAENPGNRVLPAHFGFDLRYLPEAVPNPAAGFPYFTAPPLTGSLPVEAARVIEPETDDFRPLVAVAEGPVVVLAPHGRGTIILSTLVKPFTNSGLKAEANAAFVRNIVAQVPEGTEIWFDEWHHGKRPALEAAAGPGAWLRTRPAGRAVLFSTAVVFIWLAVSGRGFGRPLPPEREVARRTPLEFIAAIANLNRRAGNRRALLEHYRSRLKRHYGRRFRIDPNLADDPFLTQLKAFLPTERFETVHRLLADMDRPDPSEADMVRLANQSAHLLTGGEHLLR